MLQPPCALGSPWLTARRPAPRVYAVQRERHADRSVMRALESTSRPAPFRSVGSPTKGSMAFSILCVEMRVSPFPPYPHDAPAATRDG